jgi:hypothetical protein
MKFILILWLGWHSSGAASSDGGLATAVFEDSKACSDALYRANKESKGQVRGICAAKGKENDGSK